MKLQRREKILLAVTGGLAVVAIVWLLFVAGDNRSVDKLRTDRQTRKGDVKARQKELDAARSDAARLADWQRRALPSDSVVAQSLYPTWLRALVKESNLRQWALDPKGSESKHDVYTKFSFTLHGEASWADLTAFLFNFYSAGHLHQIRELKIKPLRDPRNLELTMTIEALSLPKATRKDELSKEPGRPLLQPTLADYRDTLVQRNLFAPYVESRRRPLDAALYAFVTGIIEVDGLRQVWLKDRLTDKLWKLNEGENFQIGDTSGTVRKIASAHEVIVDFDGHRRRLREGDNLRGGVEVRE